MSPVAESQGELPVRSMSDSYSELIIPLSDVGSRQKYLNPSMKGIRFGRILEDLDTFSGTCKNTVVFVFHLPFNGRYFGEKYSTYEYFWYCTENLDTSFCCIKVNGAR